MKTLVVIASSLGGILLFLLASASANTALFARHYPWLLGINAIVALALFALIVWQVRLLWREHRAKVFGSRLKLRLLLAFGLMAVLPGVLIYAVSVQFVTKSIETWFDVRVENALESGINLARSAFDSLLDDLAEKGRGFALELGELPEAQWRAALSRLREQSGVQYLALFSTSGQLLATATSDLSVVLPPAPTPEMLRQARAGRISRDIVENADAQDLVLRVLVPVISSSLGMEMRVLQLTQPVPGSLALNAERVQDVYRDYQELSLGRQGLTRIYAMTLTLTLLFALLTAIALAFVLARNLSAPLSILAEGTQAVAAGDFTPRQAIDSHDELGVLTRSFNRMTRQLDDARRDTERHRAEVESARAYLESILAHISAGVLVFDRQFRLRTVNAGAQTILDDRFTGLVDAQVDAWTRQQVMGQTIRKAFTEHGRKEWRMQIELARPGGVPRLLSLRGTPLPEGADGFVVVFDDVTHLVAAQRSAAWGEVARRLAHEIKNPLTPIQLSAERMQLKLAGKLDKGGAEMLGRSTQTIINQVQAMKRMVNEFSDYARLPSPTLAELDLNALIHEVLGLYETSQAAIAVDLDTELPPLLGDAAQLRQIIHNLLRNAEEAQTAAANPSIRLSTRRVGDCAEFKVSDAGPGFPEELIGRVFEPYVTTKAGGTGLGLAIVKKIVDEHHGLIRIDNRQPSGAEVSLQLPLALEQVAQS
ncbi:MAG: HAMP domain-containing protein [Candidatus Accumulibacter sp.]|nr:HAMP domain-containing protein [Accumulibacter sp.]